MPGPHHLYIVAFLPLDVKVLGSERAEELKCAAPQRGEQEARPTVCREEFPRRKTRKAAGEHQSARACQKRAPRAKQRRQRARRRESVC